jgi:transposase
VSQCSATTTKGAQCRRTAAPGHDRCVVHLAPGGWPGRPSLLTEQLVEKLVTMLRAGNYMGTAARASGISRQTLTSWLERGASARPEDEEYRDLRERVERARSEGEVRLVATIARAAAERWDAAAWLLERQYPDRWGRVSMRLRADAQAEAEAAAEAAARALEHDPFAEVDELAAKRRSRRPG